MLTPCPGPGHSESLNPAQTRPSMPFFAAAGAPEPEAVQTAARRNGKSAATPPGKAVKSSQSVSPFPPQAIYYGTIVHVLVLLLN